jgi:hypothetical protein
MLPEALLSARILMLCLKEDLGKANFWWRLVGCSLTIVLQGSNPVAFLFHGQSQVESRLELLRRDGQGLFVLANCGIAIAGAFEGLPAKVVIVPVGWICVLGTLEFGDGGGEVFFQQMHAAGVGVGASKCGIELLGLAIFL